MLLISIYFRRIDYFAVYYQKESTHSVEIRILWPWS